MISANNVFLVGPMGAGKTTIGRVLANLLKKQFIDLDSEIERRCGADIPWIFDVEGEVGFRDREAAVLADLCDRSGMVVATGGGAVLRPENRKLLQESGYVIYLQVSAQELYERTRTDTNRPLLQVANRREVIDRLLSEREHLYREVADLSYTGNRRGPKYAAEEILRQMATT
ncbi:MAG: shikimate kinase AroK [Porticoccaceae bacterium]